MFGFITRLSAFLGVSALCLTLLAIAPAQAASPDAQRATTSASSVVKSSVHTPDVTFIPKTSRGIRINTGTSSVSVDWSWWRGGWDIHLSRFETNAMAFSFSSCLTVVGVWLPKPWALGLYAACGALATFAGIASLWGKCVAAFVPVSLINTQPYTRNCG